LTLKQAGHTVSVVLEDGEICSGPWSTLPSVVSAKELSAEWDVVYGSGFYVAHVLRTQINRATLAGNRGTTLQVENGDVAPRSAGHTRVIMGVAKDSRGNIYKLNF
jgi:hypothetical protein